MITTPINSASTNSAVETSSASSSRVPQKTLGQDEFLRLLIAQLTSQDPLNPQKDTEFISQMAQFSSLEQAKGMQTSLAAMRSQQEFVQANAMLGKEVNVRVDRDTVVTGVVSAVNIQSGIPKIVVNNQAYDITSVLSVAIVSPKSILPSKNSNQIKQYASLS